MAGGMILGGLVFYRNALRLKLDTDKMLDLLLVAIPAGIIGARLYYVIFNWSWYLNSDGRPDFFKIVNIRMGGLAIHGALIFAFLAAYLICRKYKYNPLDVFDAGVPGIALAQAIGRWGNFFNQEAHGGPTNLPWGILVDGEMVHPTFLYESIWCFFLFLFLMYGIKRRTFSGQVLFLYGGLYSIERFLVEGLRTDSLMLGPLRQAQVLSLLVLLLSIFLYGYFKKKNRDIIIKENLDK